MPYNPRIHHRRSIRLAGYDYRSPGAYFFTTCILGRRCLLGEVCDGTMICNALGAGVWDIWRGLPEHYPHVRLDSFVVMPNHAHGIVELTATTMPPGKTRHSFFEIMRSFKTFSAARMNVELGTPGRSQWQPNYWERIVRNPGELDRIRRYIENNPRRWEQDRLSPRRSPR